MADAKGVAERAHAIARQGLTNASGVLIEMQTSCMPIEILWRSIMTQRCVFDEIKDPPAARIDGIKHLLSNADVPPGNAKKRTARAT